MATARQIINKAKSYVGMKESPAGSNNVIFNTDYYGRPVSGSAYPWCCAFVWDIFRMCGASNLFYGGGKTASCTAVLRWAQQNNLIVNKNDGQPGDIILFDWDYSGDADHIGFVEYRNSNGSYTTIEGNTAVGNDSNGGEVMERTRSSCIRAIIRPKYDKESGVLYRAHCQKIGWQDWKSNGETAGTTGQSKRLEAIQVKLENIAGSVVVEAHVQKNGWLPAARNGAVAGKTGESKRLEAVKIYLEGAAAQQYDIYYRLHCQTYGWLDWAKNGAIAGTVGLSKRAEAIEIRLVKKGGQAPGATARPVVKK